MTNLRNWPVGAYGDAVADVYDQMLEPMADRTMATVEFLSRLASGGRALELGIGTGRIALRLAARGVRIHGIDASPKMAAKLSEKVGSLPVTIAIGDFVAVPAHGMFDVTYVVFNTFYGLPTQPAQIACVQKVASRLRPGGKFVVEAFVPDPRRFDGWRDARASSTDDDWLEVVRHDSINQHIVAHQVLHTAIGTKVLPIHMRYVWPSELDLIAQLAGLELTDRFGGWCGEPFTGESASHVSVYTKPRPSTEGR